jgi:hypothetical protein
MNIQIGGDRVNLSTNEKPTHFTTSNRSGRKFHPSAVVHSSSINALDSARTPQSHDGLQ